MELDEGSVPYRFITEVARAGEKASVLVRQILGFSRRQTLDMKNIDLNNIVSDLTRMLSKVIGEQLICRYTRARNRCRSGRSRPDRTNPDELVC